ncbi:MAG TPA: dienelactone hydrolase family protein [Flavisolibacter sp.]|jgi:phospholipase/carboxylesterase|nr:dienelactone hydrolase family protein [Flavisolibacter sp.]
MHTKQISIAGKDLTANSKVLLMLHGRGATAQDILSLAGYLDVKEFTLLAPQATNHTWYPYSFMAPTAQNEPWLSSALALLKEITGELLAKGIPSENIYFLGFSQGACLTLEFVARNARRYGGVAAFTGGLIGDTIHPENYAGDFQQTPVFIGTSDPDPHVPVTRVYASANILRDRNANVTEKVYAGMGHTINQDEMDQVNQLLFSKTIKEII